VLGPYIRCMVLRISSLPLPGFSRVIIVIALCARSGTGLAEEPTPDSIAAVDAALPKMAALLPSQIDADSDLIKIRRENSEIIYTIQLRPQSQAKADQIRKFAASSPQAAMLSNMSLMKQIACKPEPNRFLKDGFAIVWEIVDAKGPISRSSLSLA